MMKLNLRELFNQLNSKPFRLVKPGGNWGDELIYFGAEHLAASCNLNFESFSKPDFLSSEARSESVVYIHGGGGFNEWCSNSAFECLKHATSHYKDHVIYGPCSSTTNVEFLEAKFGDCLAEMRCEHLYIFTRDRTTLEIFNSMDAFKRDNISIHLDKDTAFHLTKAAVLNRIGGEQNRYVLYGFREDNEACPESHDVNYSDVVLDPPYFCNSFEHWLKVHAYAESIITNRTHSSIIGAILEKPTSLFSGSYHKNRSIWEDVLKDMGVKWLDANEAIGLINEGLLDRILPNKVKNSWKVRHAYLALKGVPLR